jgi:hypothetical protein
MHVARAVAEAVDLVVTDDRPPRLEDDGAIGLANDAAAAFIGLTTRAAQGVDATQRLTLSGLRGDAGADLRWRDRARGLSAGRGDACRRERRVLSVPGNTGRRCPLGCRPACMRRRRIGRGGRCSA